MPPLCDPYAGPLKSISNPYVRSLSSSTSVATGGLNAGPNVPRARVGALRPHASLRPLGRERVRLAMLDLILGGGVALFLAIYLVFALLHPEKL